MCLIRYPAYPNGSSLVANEKLNKLQNDVLAALQQSSRTPLSSNLPQQVPLGQPMLPAVEGAPAQAVVGEQHLIFLLRDREFAVKAELVQGVERLFDLTPIPNVVPWVKGVINLRGAITSVVDLRMFLDLEQVTYSARTRLLSLQYNEMVICFAIDGVNEMLPIPASA